jgi:hypothetical protein
MRELLKRHDVDLNAQDNNGDTPLIRACTDSHLLAATILIGAGADVALLNNAGHSALFFANWCVQQDEDEAGEEDEDEDADARRERLAARDKLHEQHRLVVALLKGHGVA